MNAYYVLEFDMSMTLNEYSDYVYRKPAKQDLIPDFIITPEEDELWTAELLRKRYTDAIAGVSTNHTACVPSIQIVNAIDIAIFKDSTHNEVIIYICANQHNAAKIHKRLITVNISQYCGDELINFLKHKVNKLLFANKNGRPSSVLPSDESAVYPKEDPVLLGAYYIKHVEAMTKEDLHEKSDIAVQLGLRDRIIDQLQSKIKDLEAKLEKLSAIEEIIKN